MKTSMAAVLKDAGLVTEDQFRVAEQLKQDIEEVESELHLLGQSTKGLARKRGLETRLQILRKTRVIE